MSGGNDGGGSWSSKFLKVAGAAAATAAVAGGLYALMASSASGNSELEVPFGARGNSNRPHHESGWWKMKVDGSGKDSCGSPSAGAGCGGFLRDESEKWIIGFAHKLDPSYESHMTEIQAILKGLQLASEMNVEKLIVETDNDSVVSMVKNGLGFKYSRPHFNDIEHISKLISYPKWKVELVSIPREENRVANTLARSARTLPSYDLFKYPDPPGICTQLLLQEGVTF